MNLTLAQIAASSGALLSGDPDAVVFAVAPLDEAGPGELSFAADTRRIEQVAASGATAVFVPNGFPSLDGVNLLHVEHPREALIALMERLYPPVDATPGIHPRAVVSEGAEVAADAAIGPCAVIEHGARIASGCLIGAGAFVGEGVVLGRDCRIAPNVSLMAGCRLGKRVIVHAGSVIGADGFGYVWRGDHHHKIPQVGGVEIGDDVEIGANSCIDRAMMGTTRIGAGTKIDNQVQVGHNDQIGRHVILVAQVGLSGSVEVGDGAVLAGQAGVADHLKIGARAVVGAASGVTGGIDAGEKVWGVPARPIARVLREQAALAQLPALLKQVRRLQKRIDELDARPGEKPDSG